MATRGPKKKTASNSRPRPDRESLWQGFSPPKLLNDAETREYHRLVANLRRIGTLDTIDPSLVIATARTIVMLEQAHAELAGSSLTIESGNGTAMPHPAVGTVNRLTTRLRALMSDLGLTPATAKYGVPKSSDDSGWEGLLGVVSDEGSQI
jgi:P27 family predicted phage terminase small subunit